jgi:hypothetical protein
VGKLRELGYNFGYIQQNVVIPCFPAFLNGGFKFQVQHFLKGDKVLYFNGFDDCGNIGRGI